MFPLWEGACKEGQIKLFFCGEGRQTGATQDFCFVERGVAQGKKR